MENSPPSKTLSTTIANSSPNNRRYPKELWQQIIPLAQYGPQTLAKELGINLGNLFKRIKVEGTALTLFQSLIALPHNITSN